MNAITKASFYVAIYLLSMLPKITLASSPEAWLAHEKEVTSRCMKASGLRNAKPAGDIIDFDDRVGFTALLIIGTYPQPHMNNRKGHSLCLFDRRTRMPYVSEANLITK